eukprot:6312923-Lingulodinium_polyedra.AAC.1
MALPLLSVEPVARILPLTSPGRSFVKSFRQSKVPRSSRAAMVRLGSLARDQAHGNQLFSTSKANQRAEREEPSAGSSQPPTQARPPSAL